MKLGHNQLLEEFLHYTGFCMIISFALSDAAVRVGCPFCLAVHLGKVREEKNRKRHIFLEIIHVQLNISSTQLCVLVCVFSYHVAATPHPPYLPGHSAAQRRTLHLELGD